MIRIKYCTLTVIHFRATIPYDGLETPAPPSVIPRAARDPLLSVLLLSEGQNELRQTPHFQEHTNAYSCNSFGFISLQIGGGVFSQPKKPRSLTGLRTHTNTRKPIPFMRLLHSSLYTPGVGVPRVGSPSRAVISCPAA